MNAREQFHKWVIDNGIVFEEYIGAYKDWLTCMNMCPIEASVGSDQMDELKKTDVAEIVKEIANILEINNIHPQYEYDHSSLYFLDDAITCHRFRNMINIIVPKVYHKNVAKVQEFLDNYKDKHIGRSYVNVLLTSTTGLTVKPHTFPQVPFIRENYVPNNVNRFEALKKYIFEPKNKGRLTILKGEPGTGKSMWIKGLINECPQASFIFLPVDSAATLSSPHIFTALLNKIGHNYYDEGMNEFISSSPESKKVIIVEDGDNLLKKRDGADSYVSNFLNLCDGLLGDVLNIHVIVSTNLEWTDFDPAVMRPGRLYAKMEFDRIPFAQSADIYKRDTGKDFAGQNKSYTLAEIYAEINEHNNDHVKSTREKTGQYL